MAEADPGSTAVRVSVLD